MIITPGGTTPPSVTLPDGREAWLTEKEHRQALAHAKLTNDPDPDLADIVKVMHEVQAEDQEDTRRRWLICRMAMHGEFGGVARQLKLWGVEPAE